MTDFPLEPEAFLAQVRREIPLSQHLGLQALEHDGDELQLCFALAPNVNVHGTAFAGSLYTACVLSGWSLATRALCDLHGRPEVVVRNADIHYRRPVCADFTVRCHAAESNGLAVYRQAVIDGAPARVDLVAEIRVGTHAEVRFHGTYVHLLTN